MNSLTRKLAIAAALICAPTLLWGQTVTGVISGTVTDPTGEAIPGAAITLTNESTADMRSATTDTAGNFVFPSVLPGAYTVKAEAKGFQTLERKGNQLTPNGRLALGSLQLAIGSVSETVTVSAQGSNVQTASAEGSALMTTHQLETISGKGRDPVGMLWLLPGVETLNPKDSVGGSYSNVSTPRIGGLPTSANTITVDGLPATDLGSAGTHVVYTAFDTASEVTVLLNNYQAEYGRAGGAFVNIVSKSGSKSFHGTVFWYKRHEMFNANTWTNNRSGLPIAKYRYLSEGFSFGGPVTIPKLFNTSREKLFFFVAVEKDPAKMPLGMVTNTMPTALERAGNFTQSFNTANQLEVINDPNNNKAPFPGNIIPASRINPSGQALLNVFVLPNQLNTALTGNTYNYQFQESLDQAKLTTNFRIDYSPTDKDTVFFHGMAWGNSEVGWNGSGGGPGWPMVQDSLQFLVRTAVLGYTRILSPSIVNEFHGTIRRVYLNHPLPAADQLSRIQRNQIGFTAGQLYPQNNPQNIIPLGSFTGVISNAPSFGSYWSERYPAHRIDTVATLADGVTVTHGGHTFKAGVYYERAVILSVPGFGAPWMGSLSFNRDTNNPFDANHPFANAILGIFDTYTEPTTKLQPKAAGLVEDWYVQDSWRVSRRLTLELGIRIAHPTMYQELDGNIASFALSRYNPQQAPTLYQPVMVGATRMALNPLTGQTTYAALIGAYVPGTGNTANGMVTSRDPNYPWAFVNGPGEIPQPRFGLAWDPFGNGKTAVRMGFGMYNSMVRNEPQSTQAPICYTPTMYYGNLNTFLSGTGYLFPSSTSGWDKTSRPPSSYNLTAGVQRQIGFGTVMEVKYVGTLARDTAVSQNLNTLPYGIRFLAKSIDPTTGKAYPDSFLEQMPGYTTVTYNEDAGSSEFHSMQVNASRRFVHNLEFTGSWVWSKWLDYTGLPLWNNWKVWSYGMDGGDQTHRLVFTYTYSLPGPSQSWSNKATRFALGNWQLSGMTMFTSGEPSSVSFTTTAGTDQTGGGDGQRINVTCNPNLPYGSRVWSAMFNTACFANPGMNSRGNAPVTVIRLPGHNDWDMTLFKNFPIRGEGRQIQFRWEAYNLFNHTQFSSVNTSAIFNNTTGAQTNSLFGQATGVNPARVMQVSLRLRF